MTTEKINVNPNNPQAMFEDSNLVGKIISVKYNTSHPQEYLVIGKSERNEKVGFQMAAVIRRNPITLDCIDSFTAESLPNKPLHFCFAESVHKGHPNYANYEKKLQGVVR